MWCDETGLLPYTSIRTCLSVPSRLCTWRSEGHQDRYDAVRCCAPSNVAGLGSCVQRKHLAGRCFMIE